MAKTYYLLPKDQAKPSDIRIQVADGKRTKAHHRGNTTATVNTAKGVTTIDLNDLLVIPGMAVNLLSTTRLAKDGWLMLMWEPATVLLGPRNQVVVAEVDPDSGARYLMLWQHDDGKAMAASKDKAKLWHWRLGHLSLGGLKKMVGNSNVKGLGDLTKADIEELIEEEQRCDVCVVANQKQAPYPTGSETKVRRRLERVLCDIMGPFEGHNIYLYILTLVDEWSRKTWAIPIPDRTSATIVEQLTTWALRVETQAKEQVTSVHTDNAKEFTSQETQDWAKSHGVSWTWTAPYSSKQNGIAERHNGLIQEKGRAMLLQARLPKSFWPYAFEYATYVLNRTTSKAIGNNIPEAKWSGRAVDLELMRTFGCLAWAIIHADQRKEGKLSVRGQRGIFLGCAEDHKAWLIYCPHLGPNALRWSRSAVFDEKRTYDDALLLETERMILPRIDEETTMEVPIPEPSTRSRPLQTVEGPTHIPGTHIIPEGDPLSWTRDEVELVQDVQAPTAPLHDPISEEREIEEVEPDWPIVQMDDIINPGPELPSANLPSLPIPQLQDPFTIPSWDPNESTEDDNEVITEMMPTPNPIYIPNVEENDNSDDPLQRPLDIWRQTPDIPAPPRRSTRTKQPQAHTVWIAFAESLEDAIFGLAVGTTTDGVLLEPKNVEEAKARGGKEWEAWKKAMEEELGQLSKMGTWKLVPRPPGRKIVGCKWVLKVKTDSEGRMQKRKARLVAKGYSQLDGIDYEETFAPVARLVSVRLIISFAHKHQWVLISLDAKSAYLNGYLDEEIYMEQPPGFEDGKGSVCLLVRSLYGLKQAGRAWFLVLQAKLLQGGYKELQAEPCIFYLTDETGEPSAMLTLYVDDFVIAAKDQATADKVKGDLNDWFSMTDNGVLTYILGIKVEQHVNGKTHLSQTAYINKIIQEFPPSQKRKPTSPIRHQGPPGKHEGTPLTGQALIRFASLVGMLLWVAQGTRLDIAYIVGHLARFLSCGTDAHFDAALRVVGYLEVTKDDGITFSSSDHAMFLGYVDADHTGDEEQRRSTSGYVFQHYGNTISWHSKLQATTAASTVESEYIALAAATAEAQFLRHIMEELQIPPPRATDIYTDSTGAEAISRNLTFSKLTKHIEPKFHIIRQRQALGEINVLHIEGDNNPADYLTKPKSATAITRFNSKLGIGPHPTASTNHTPVRRAS
ncbi:hypothetical protein CF319_g3014 [Tilletia indica]|nr:hypothetical protein CF319_g3014 [Tilletia indica]